MGNGDMGKALSPSPALLAYMIRRPIAVDEYLLWSVSEGGMPLDTKMPAFKNKLSREEIWKNHRLREDEPAAKKLDRITTMLAEPILTGSHACSPITVHPTSPTICPIGSRHRACVTPVESPIIR